MYKIFAVISLVISLTSTAFGKSALIIVDMQNCFVDGEDTKVHSLPVKGGLSLVSKINKFQKNFDVVVATYDWHPINHVSFASQHENKKPFESIELEDGTIQALWPDHCVQGTKGAELLKGLDTNKITKKIFKGDHAGVDSYSGFFNNNKSSHTELNEYLQSEKVTDIYVVGLAADFCVKFTSLDGASLKYNTYFVEDLTKAVFPDNIEKSTYVELRKNNVNIINSNQARVIR